MKQLVQDFKSGEILVVDVPQPVLKADGVLVNNSFSLISAGTEKRTVETGKASMVGKAIMRPDLVKQVIDNVKRDGLLNTYKKVQNKLESLKALGYSSSGIVVESLCSEFRPGDRVACAGGGYASHAESIFVPKNLCVKIPENVSLEEASFVTLGAIAMQGVRQAKIQIGDRVVVIGTGLLGLLTIGILKAAGCTVIGADVSDNKFQIARTLGCDELCSMDDLPSHTNVVTNGNGADAVIITASTLTNGPIEIAGEIARSKARVVVVGAVGMNVPRDPHYYKKELEIAFSCSYGPGRYDTNYEEKGIDYPFAYVRWTEKRNMESFLTLISQGKLTVKPLITHEFSINDAISAYDLVIGKRKENYTGILLKYDANQDQSLKKVFSNPKAQPNKNFGIGFIGAGNFAQSNLLPHIKKMGMNLGVVCTANGINAKSVAEKYGFLNYTTDAKKVLEDENTKVVFITTRHDTHAKYVMEALKAGKHVFVEKPLCINESELFEIDALYQTLLSKGNAPLLMVGFNRRFSPYAKEVKTLFGKVQEPISISYRINAGILPDGHWLYAADEGGGRIVGEGCHFIDFVQYMASSPINKVFATKLPNVGKYNDDNAEIILQCENGSIGRVSYLANGNKAVDKEYIEISGGSKTAIISDYKEAIIYDKNQNKIKDGLDKGWADEVKEFLLAVKEGKSSPIPYNQLINSMQATFKVLESLKLGETVTITPLL